MRTLPLTLTLACAPADPAGTAFVFPDVAPQPVGPGAVSAAFADAQLFAPCGWLRAGPDDPDRHGPVAPFDGFLALPWGDGVLGGLSTFDLADPCAPAERGHSEIPGGAASRAFSSVSVAEGPAAGRWAATATARGVQLWDVTDATLPTPAGSLTLESGEVTDLVWTFPDLYASVTDGRILVIDGADPSAPAIRGAFRFDDGMVPGDLDARGTWLLVTADRGARAALLDIATPDAPSVWAGSPFTLTDEAGAPRRVWSGGLSGDTALFGRMEDGGGPIVYDLATPDAPTWSADLHIPAAGGGLVMFDEGYLFVAGTTRADVIDRVSGGSMYPEGDVALQGDLHAITPIGSFAVVSVDRGASLGEASAIVPWTTSLDQAPPLPLATTPADGAEGVAITARVGVQLNELIEPVTAVEGTVRMYADDDDTAVRGAVSVQGATLTYSPTAPLTPGTRYRVELVPGGVADPQGNAITTLFTSRFTTAR